MAIAISLVIVGFIALIFGANWLVSGAASLAKKHHIPDLVVGLTIVAFGTSAPELVVSTLAASSGAPDIALGNVIGSNNFNLFIILGLSGVVFPMVVKPSSAWYEIPMSLLAAIVLFLLANGFFIFSENEISRVDAFILLIGFGLFMGYIVRQTRKGAIPEEIPDVVHSNIRIWIYIVLGLGGLVLGGTLVVENSVKIAEILGISEKIIGLTIVAAGTSLPELATSVTAAFKRNGDIAIGNVIGSNIFNILLILSVSGLIHPMQYNPSFNTDMYILFGGTVFLFASLFVGKRYQIARWQAFLMLIFYIGYTVYLVRQA
ncbi:MAG: calcium/sodium antiporter [Capnocytophaga sp.]|nr:calcium/sodium antiporter [Capnocytophaga sp.]